MIRFLFFLLVTVSILVNESNVLALEKGDESYDAVLKIVNTVQTGNESEIAKLFQYPLNRHFPVPDISDESEMVKRFDEIFDEKLISQITSSNIGKDWSAVGWRGTMLNRGTLWIRGDKIVAINHRTKKEALLAERLEQEMRESMHPSLHDFEQPILEWDTKKFHIRIDQLKDKTYRYASWKRGTSISSKPDLILLNGKKVFEGNGGNNHFDFKNGAYLYRCSIIHIGKIDSPPGRLEVFKNQKLLLSDDLVKEY